VRVAVGDEDVGSHLIVDLLAEHDESRNGDGKIKKILETHELDSLVSLFNRCLR